MLILFNNVTFTFSTLDVLEDELPSYVSFAMSRTMDCLSFPKEVFPNFSALIVMCSSEICIILAALSRL